MMNSIRQALTTKEIRRKLELMVIIVFFTRIMSMIPVPGVDTSVFKKWMSANTNDALSLFSAFTGGSFESFSMFALGITPLITAQIIMQMASIAIKPLAKLQKKGEHGQKVIKKITNICAIILTLAQSVCMGIGFNKSGMISGGVIGIISLTVFITAGTGIMIWLSNILTEKTIGNGVSLLLMANITSQLPKQLKSLIVRLTNGKSTWVSALSVAGAILTILVMTILVIYMTEGYHPLHVQYSHKMSQSGEDAETGQIPMKVGVSGVMPVIFASVIMSIPQLIATLTGKGYGSGYSKIILEMLSQKNWFDNEHPMYAIGMLIYLALIVIFAFFYLTIAFNAAEVADNIRKSGGFVPGVRAGEDTEIYIQNISRYLATIGTVMLIVVTMVPIVLCGSLGLSTVISGTSMIIVIGVATETVQQIQLELAGRNYCGLLARD